MSRLRFPRRLVSHSRRRGGAHHHRRHHAAADAERCSLVEVQPGKVVEVVDLEAGASAGQRLRSMGILPGTVIHVLRSAPLGGPLLIEVQGMKIALGRGVAAMVLVSHRAGSGEDADHIPEQPTPKGSREGPCGSS